MATKFVARTRLSFSHQSFNLSRRTFITLPGTESQSLEATRILPYRSASLYSLVADVDSYSAFLPYCLDSKVTAWSSPDTNGKRWPSEANLKVGWGGYEETFTSKLFCVPGIVVEALSGSAITSLPKSELTHYASTVNSPAHSNHIFRFLSTRWTIKPLNSSPIRSESDEARYLTEVHLSLDFQFANPIYAALSKAVAPRIAGIMIEAFEIRARDLLDGRGLDLRDDAELAERIRRAEKA